jgi:hypothetical protein
MLHGMFDFSLMLVALIEASKAPDDQDENGDDDSEAESLGDLKSEIVPLMISFGLVTIGMIYYCIAARRQHKRLVELEQGDQGGEGSLVAGLLE